MTRSKKRPDGRGRLVSRLLCVSNFPANTGFAWDFIEGLYAGLASRLDRLGVETWVAYPRLDSLPEPLKGSPAQPVLHRWGFATPAQAAQTVGFVRRLGFDAVYLSDRPAWHPLYAMLRSVGVGAIVTHDHTSGTRTIPGRVHRAVKKARIRLIPGGLADRVVTVSDYVARRKTTVDMIPVDRVTRIWNSVEVPGRLPDERERMEYRRLLRVDPDRPLVLCVGRASPEKGLSVMFRAFARVWRDSEGQTPVLAYLGDGPELSALRALRDSLECASDIRLCGYVDRAADYTAAADVSVVPSIWQEAFGLSALESLSRGVPVIASAVGGLPEVVRDGSEGVLVPPGDEVALAEAMGTLLRRPQLRRDMGRRGFERARTCFSRPHQLDLLEKVFRNKMKLGSTS